MKSRIRRLMTLGLAVCTAASITPTAAFAGTGTGVTVTDTTAENKAGGDKNSGC